MEPISFAVGIVSLAGLFSVCLDVIDKVDSYKEFGVESRSVIAQFEADKHLFKKWAQDVGIDKDKQNSICHSYLDNPETNLIIQRILSSIQEIFSKAEGTVSNLQPVAEANATPFSGGIHSLSTRKKSQNFEGTISKRGRIAWSLRNKARFIQQVQQFGALVQRLHSLIPPDGLTGQVKVHKGIIGDDLSSRNDETTWFADSQRLLAEMEKQIEHERKKELDIWLGASQTNDVYDNSLRKRLDGTCDWILSRQAFLDWTSTCSPSGTAKILWINGPAGHGKTIICARVIQYLSSIFESPVAYFFCSSDSESRRHPLTIIRSWIAQVIRCNRDAFELAFGVWESKGGRNASQTDIADLFKTIVQHTPNCTFVVDGLDEYMWVEEKWKSNDDDSPIDFFESIREAVAHTTSRILIISRDEPEIRHGCRIVLSGDSDQDLNEYQIRPDDVQSDAMVLSRSIVDKKLANKSETLKRELSQRMVDRSGGMFLWVKMLDLRSGKNKKQLEETIDQAPTILDRLYDRVWKKISYRPERDKLRALSILRWTAFALRPLTILEITEALLIVDDDREDLSLNELPDAIDEDYVGSEILGLCGSLLEVQKAAPEQGLGSMTLHLAHFSVKQYILGHMPARGGLLMADERLRASSETFQSNILAKLCLRYLNVRNVWQEYLQLESGPVKRPFRDYAADSWHHHIRENGSNYDEVVKLTNSFFSSNNGSWESWRTWFHANDNDSLMYESKRATASTGPLFYASLLGLRNTVMYLLEEAQLCVNHVDEFNRTALQAAALQGQTCIVKLLLKNGADVNFADNEGWTPLNRAVNGGYIEVVKLLFEKGADVTITNNEGWTLLCIASYWGYTEIVRLLLENGADVKVTDNKGWTPLNLASYKGYTEIVRLLLEKGADVEVVNNKGWTPLNTASNRGYIEIVRLLLEKGANVTVANNDGWTPLGLASEGGHIDVVRLLLAEKVKVETNDGAFSETPLSSAAKEGHEAVVRLLLENGAKAESKNSRGQTPLSRAAAYGREVIVKLLLAAGGVEPDSKDGNGRTPLFYSARNGHKVIVELLLATKRVDVDSKDHYNSTPLSIATRRGHIEVVVVLLTQSRGLCVKDNFGRTPLWWAKRTEHPDIADFLLQKYKEKCISVQNDDLPGTTTSILTDENFRACEICVLDIPDKDAYYHCKVCNEGNFDICHECFAMKAHCLDESHTLVKEMA